MSEGLPQFCTLGVLLASLSPGPAVALLYEGPLPMAERLCPDTNTQDTLGLVSGSVGSQDRRAFVKKEEEEPGTPCGLLAPGLGRKDAWEWGVRTGPGCCKRLYSFLRLLAGRGWCTQGLSPPHCLEQTLEGLALVGSAPLPSP